MLKAADRSMLGRLLEIKAKNGRVSLAYAIVPVRN